MLRLRNALNERGVLGINRRKLYRLVEKYGIDV